MDGRGTDGDRAVVYRLRVRGRLAPGWREWFDADRLEADGPDTTLHVRVTDQAGLHARLRRIHDLNLTLVAVDRLDGPAENTEPEAP